MSNLQRKIRKRWVRLLDVFYLTKPRYFQDVPIIINNYNRLTMLRHLIAGLEERGYHNIWVIDNNSTYPPLLKWMEEVQNKYYFIRLHHNAGHLSLFETGLYKRFWKGYYIYTDSDISLPGNFPVNFVERLWGGMQRKLYLEKCGCALRIDNIPDTFSKKQQVVDWERQFWKFCIDDAEEMYRGGVDTTFALYRPMIIPNLSPNVNCRVAGELTVVHAPWYVDSNNLSEEEKYYIEHCQTSTHWSGHK